MAVDQQAVDMAMSQYSTANSKKAEHLRLVAIHTERAATEQAAADAEDATAQIARSVLILFGVDPSTL